jgi:hypothetical protein
MAKVTIQNNPKVNQIFDDLEKLLEFCVEYGYKYDEANLYDMRSYTYQQYTKYATHKNFKDGWSDDARKMSSSVYAE